MIALDQVLLLQKRVEAAVEKIRELNACIEQLKSENAALLREKAELSKALSDKTGLVSSLEAEQNKIEDTILQALEQLNIVENSIIDSSSSALQNDPAVRGDVQIQIQPAPQQSGESKEASDVLAQESQNEEPVITPTIHFEPVQSSEENSAAQSAVRENRSGSIYPPIGQALSQAKQSGEQTNQNNQTEQNSAQAEHTDGQNSAEQNTDALSAEQSSAETGDATDGSENNQFDIF